MAYGLKAIRSSTIGPGGWYLAVAAGGFLLTTGAIALSIKIATRTVVDELRRDRLGEYVAAMEEDHPRGMRH